MDMSPSLASIVQSLVKAFMSEDASGHLRVDLGPVDECKSSCRSPSPDIVVGGVSSIATVVGLVSGAYVNVGGSGQSVAEHGVPTPLSPRGAMAGKPSTSTLARDGCDDNEESQGGRLE